MEKISPLLRYWLILCWISYPLLYLFFPNVGFIRDGGIALPLFVFNTSGIIIYWMGQKLMRKKNNAALLSALLILGFQLYGHLYYGIMDGLEIPYSKFQHRYYFPIYIIFLAIPSYFLIRKKEVSLNIILVFTLMGTLLCSQFSVDAIKYSGKETPAATATPQPEKKLETPDIFYLILDSYSHEENLKEFYDFNNSAFLDTLERLNFQVIPQAKSNYPYTYFSLSSSLNMRYVNDFEDSVKLEKYDDDYPFTQVQYNEVVRYLRNKGYQYVLSKSAYDQLNDPASADVFVDNSSTLNQYHQAVVSLSLLSAFNLGSFYHHKNYDITKQAYANWGKILSIKGSKFVFFHSLPPHPPFVFNTDGSYRDKEGRTENLYAQKDDYTAQTEYVNKAVLKSVRQILIQTKGDAIIIVQGDHGTCSSTAYSDEMKWPLTAPEELIRERYGILNAIYIPEKYRLNFEADHTPVNTFRKIFNAVFSDSLHTLENHHYYGRYRPPYGWKEIEVKN